MCFAIRREVALDDYQQYLQNLTGICPASSVQDLKDHVPCST